MQFLVWFLLLGGVNISVAGKVPTLLYFDVALVCWLVLQVFWNHFWPDFSGWIFRLGSFWLLAAWLSAMVNIDGILRSFANIKIFAVGLLVYAIARRRPASIFVLSAWGAVAGLLILDRYRVALSDVYTHSRADIDAALQFKNAIETVLGPGNYVDSLLLLLIPIASVAAVVYKGWRRIAFISFSLCMLAGLFATLSRGALASLVLAFALGTPFLWKVSGGRAFVLAAVTTIIVLIAAVPSTLFGQYEELIQYRLNNPDEGRKEIMLASLEAFADNPVLGVGPGQIGRAIASRVLGPAGVFDDRAQFLSSHNIAIDALSEDGLPAGLCLLAMVGLVVRAAWSLSTRNPSLLGIGMFMGIVGSLLMNMVEGPYLGEQFQVIFWSVAAVVEMHYRGELNSRLIAIQ